MAGNYHWRNGWHFQRNDDNSVNISVTAGEPDGQPTGRLTASAHIPPDEWASIVAHVSAGGGTGMDYAAAQRLHMGE